MSQQPNMLPGVAIQRHLLQANDILTSKQKVLVRTHVLFLGDELHLADGVVVARAQHCRQGHGGCVVHYLVLELWGFEEDGPSGIKWPKLFVLNLSI